MDSLQCDIQNGVKLLHAAGVAHMDLSVENLMLVAVLYLWQDVSARVGTCVKNTADIGAIKVTKIEKGKATRVKYTLP